MSDSKLQTLPGERILSIDALRGFDMFWIIGAGGVFHALHKMYQLPITALIDKQLQHVEWERFRFEDLIFPLFLFIVGLVLPLSLTKRVQRGDSRIVLTLHIFKRAAVLIFLGLVYNGYFNACGGNLQAE